MIIYIYLKWKDRYLKIQIVLENRSNNIQFIFITYIFWYQIKEYICNRKRREKKNCQTTTRKEFYQKIKIEEQKQKKGIQRETPLREWLSSLMLVFVLLIVLLKIKRKQGCTCISLSVNFGQVSCSSDFRTSSSFACVMHETVISES